MGLNPSADFYEEHTDFEIAEENIAISFNYKSIDLPVLNNFKADEDEIPPEPKGLDIHLFAFKGKYYLYDIPGSASFEINEQTYNVLRKFHEEGKDDILLKDEEFISFAQSINLSNEKLGTVLTSLFELKNAGYLRIYRNNSDLMKFPPMNLGNIELHVVNACNLRCGYCFAGDGDYGYHGKSAWMTEEIAEKAVLFLLRTSKRKNVSIVFFGGEPLLNLKLMKYTAKFANEKAKEYGKTISYSVTTNATLLTDEAIEFLNSNRVYTLISIDGGKEIQDVQRPSANGKSSYDQMIDGLKKFIKLRRGKVSARVTVTAKNIDFLRISKEMEEIGFSQIYFSPASVENNNSYFLGEEENAKFHEEFEKLSLDFVERRERGDNGIKFQTLIAVSEEVAKEARNLRPCGAGLGTVAVDPNGNIFPW